MDIQLFFREQTAILIVLSWSHAGLAPHIVPNPRASNTVLRRQGNLGIDRPRRIYPEPSPFCLVPVVAFCAGDLQAGPMQAGTVSGRRQFRPQMQPFKPFATANPASRLEVYDVICNG